MIEQAKEVAQRLRVAGQVFKIGCTASDTIDALIAEVERLTKADVEPVAWLWKDGTLTADPDRADGTWTPLYPASALAALRAENERLKQHYASAVDDAIKAQAELGQYPEIQAMLMTENKKMRGALMIAAAALKHSSPHRESVNALEQHNAAIDVIITALETKT